MAEDDQSDEADALTNTHAAEKANAAHSSHSITTLHSVAIAAASTTEKSAIHGAALVKQVLMFARGSDGERVPVQLRHLIWKMTR